MIRRPVSALLVATVALVATAAVVSWQPAAVESPEAQPSGSPAATRGPSAPKSDPPLGGIGAEPVATGTSGPWAEPTPVAATPEPSVPTAATIPGTALQARLDALREKLGIPGVSATIILPDGASWTGTSGMADVRARKPVTDNTAFAIASISKTFTAALILALAEDGAIDLDARVAHYLPDLGIAGRATVRQLLDHTSGLRDYFVHPRIDERLFGDRGRAWTPEEALAHVRAPVFKPGRGWYYSNTNYLVLALLAEAVDGRPLAVQLRERFLDPLDLAHSHEQVAESPSGRLARGYRVTGTRARPTFVGLGDGSTIVPFTSVVSAAYGAGSIAASSIDVARWARALYGGDVLSPESFRAMIDDAKVTARFRPTIPYGLGVQLVALDGRAAYGHTGRLIGFRSVVRHLPAEGITIAVLTNEGNQDPSRIARALVRVLLKAPPVS